MSWKILVILLMVYMLLVILGGVVFHFIELPAEDNIRIDIRAFLEQFLLNHQCVNQAELERLLKKAVEAYSAGVVATDNATSASNWDYPAAIFFANTVVTTIGYGNISPSTPGGRVFCVIFACVGIPLTAIMLGALAEKLSKGLQKLQKKSAKCHKQDGKLASGITSCLLFLFGFTMFMLIPSIIFNAVEDWGFGDSLYYTFITLTTIGFGDFVAGQTTSDPSRIWYKLFLWFWIVIGLAWLATIISRIQEMLKKPVDKVENALAKPAGDTSKTQVEMGEANG